MMLRFIVDARWLLDWSLSVGEYMRNNNYEEDQWRHVKACATFGFSIVDDAYVLTH